MEIPSGACDCHVHVFGPAQRYPFAPGRKYTPPDALPEALLAMQRKLGLERVVIVQPSPYGTDNSCTVDALRRLDGRARGVAVIGESTPDEALKAMHEAGMRGARVNLQTAGERDPGVARGLLERTASQVAPLGWHLQTFTNVSMIGALHNAIVALPVPLVIDHFGLPRAGEGIDAIVSLVRRGKAYVKLSAPHRFAKEPDCADAAPLVRALVEANPERLVWGSDWPHPAVRHAAGPDEIEAFDEVDDAHALARLGSWVNDAALFRRILVENPARLYDF